MPRRASAPGRRNNKHAKQKYVAGTDAEKEPIEKAGTRHCRCQYAGWAGREQRHVNRDAEKVIEGVLEEAINIFKK